jgi:hypothetical protein
MEHIPGVKSQIDDIVNQCCLELFSHYEMEISSIATAPADLNLMFCGVIGFAGDDLRGSLLLACSREPLAAAGDNPRAIRDWLAELANQLLGRIKNRLITLGATIYCSTPIVLRGDHLAPFGNQPSPQLFKTNGGVASVWFEAEARPDLILAQDPDHSATVHEGETLMF